MLWNKITSDPNIISIPSKSLKSDWRCPQQGEIGAVQQLKNAMKFDYKLVNSKIEMLKELAMCNAYKTFYWHKHFVIILHKLRQHYRLRR